MRYIKGFITGVLTVFVGIFLLIRWAWKKTGMRKDYMWPRIKEDILTCLTRLFYGTDYYYVPRHYPRYVHYTDYRRKDGDKYSNPAWEGAQENIRSGRWKEANEMLRKLEEEYYGCD